MNKNTGYFNKISSGSIMDLSKLVTKVDTYEMVITKEPAQSYRYLLGYIDYNMNKVSSDGACTSNQVVGSMLYAKFMPFWEGETKSHLRPMGDRFALFNRGIDLQTVDKFWRTGVFGCQMSGDLGPKFNQRLRIDCWKQFLYVILFLLDTIVKFLKRIFVLNPWCFFEFESTVHFISWENNVK